MLWFHCDNDSGEIVTGGVATDEIARLQTAPQGRSLFIVPDGTVAAPFSEAPDFSVLKTYLATKIDSEAGALRSLYITDVPGQAQTYERKEREARVWTAGAPDSDFPFLAKEAEVRGVGIEVVQAEVMGQVNALTPLAATIEAHRMAAKVNGASATTLPAIIAAASVDWQAILAP